MLHMGTASFQGLTSGVIALLTSTFSAPGQLRRLVNRATPCQKVSALLLCRDCGSNESVLLLQTEAVHSALVKHGIGPSRFVVT